MTNPDLTFFLVKSKLSTATKSKTTTFSRVFHPKKSSRRFEIFQNLLGHPVKSETYIATLISCSAQHAGSKLTVQHSSDFLHVNTLLGSSVPIDLFTGQSLMSSGSAVVVVVVDILV